MSSEVFNSTSILETSKVLRLVDTGLEKLVDTGNSRLTHLASPKDAKDAVNKEYLEATLRGAKEEFNAIKTSVDEAKGAIDIKHNEVIKNTTDIKAIKAELQEHIKNVNNKELIVTQKAQEVEALVNNKELIVTQKAQEVEALKISIDSSKDKIAQNIETIQSIQQQLNTQANEFRDDMAGFEIKLQTALKNVEKNLTDTTNQHIEIDGKFIELRSITRDTKNELETLNQQLTDTANDVKDEISTIKLEITNRVSDLDRSILMANTASATLNSYNAKSYEILARFESNEIVEATYLLKWEIIHANTKLSANRLALAIKEGATMAYRIKYELELPKLQELKDEYRSSNDLAKDRLNKLDLMLNEADIMIRNSQFYNYLGVMI